MSKPHEVTRRQVLFGCAATVLASVIPSTSLAQTVSDSPKTNRPPVEGVINISDSGSALFSQVEQHFPGLLEVPEFEQLVPFIALFRNDTGRALKACSVSWDTTTDPDNSHRLSAHFFSRSHHSLNRVQLTGSKTLARNGEIFLVTPFLLVSKLTFKRKLKKQKVQKLLRHHARKLKPIANQVQAVRSAGRNSGEMDARVDAVVMQNFEISNQYSTTLGAHVSLRRKAEQSLARQLHRRIAGGLTEMELRQTLNESLHYKHGTGDRPAKKIFKSAQKRYARLLRRYLKKRGFGDTRSLLEKVGQRRRSLVRRAIESS